jgi:hypothetical protein
MKLGLKLSVHAPDFDSEHVHMYIGSSLKMVMFVGDPVLLKQAGSSAEGLKCRRGPDCYTAGSPSVAQGKTQGEWETQLSSLLLFSF